MANPSLEIYNVEQEHYAYSLTGELGTRFLASCVAIIIVFSNNTVIIEHRTDLELCRTGNVNEVYKLFENIADNILQIKENNFAIQ
jgi:hypothetical protein